MEFLIVCGIVVVLLVAFGAIAARGDRARKKKEPAAAVDSNTTKKVEQTISIESYEKYPKEYSEDPERKKEAFSFEVRGTYYLDREEKRDLKSVKKGDKVFFEWEQFNPADPYAIQVFTEDYTRLGYVPKEYRTSMLLSLPFITDSYVAIKSDDRVPRFVILVWYVDAYNLPRAMDPSIDPPKRTKVTYTPPPSKN